jgi:hypothetical protein
MKKELKRFLPLIVGVLVILLLVGVRAYSMGKLKEEQKADALYENGLGKDGIPALTEPSFLSVLAADAVLDDTVSGIALSLNGEEKFYSFQVLNWHGLVHDKVGGRDVLVSYSPLCGAAIVYDRNVEGKVLTFGDDGFVTENCAIIYDKETGTRWNQATGKSLDGDKELTRLFSEVMTWADFRDEHPNGHALSLETGFVREYRRHPYANYEKNDVILFPVSFVENRLAPKEPVFDVIVDGRHFGLTTKLVAFMGDLTIDENHAAFLDGAKARLFKRLVDGRTLTFVKEGNEIKDKETGSLWNSSGVSTEGEMKGKELEEVPSTARYFAFAYRALFPDAVMPGADVFDAARAEQEKTTEGTTINVGE